jgi:hypothetical protein
MPIDPDVLARSVARLEGVDPVDTGLDAALERVVAAPPDALVLDGIDDVVIVGFAEPTVTFSLASLQTPDTPLLLASPL